MDRVLSHIFRLLLLLRDDWLRLHMHLNCFIFWLLVRAEIAQNRHSSRVCCQLLVLAIRRCVSDVACLLAMLCKRVPKSIQLILFALNLLSALWRHLRNLSGWKSDQSTSALAKRYIHISFAAAIWEDLLISLLSLCLQTLQLFCFLLTF